MRFFDRVRSRAGLTAIALFAVATSAGAASLHGFAVTKATGSGGATTFLQSSATGSALQGEVNTSARTGVAIPFGVLGVYDAPGTTLGVGTAGLSSTGYGVGAESLSATNPSMIAMNSSGANGAEFYGKGSSTPGGDGISLGSSGMLAQSRNGNAIQAASATDLVASIYAEDDAPNYGFGAYFVSTNSLGYGLFGYGASGVGAESETKGAGFPALYAFTRTPGVELADGILEDSNSGKLGEVYAFNTPSQNASGSADSRDSGVSSDFQINGDIYLSGRVFSQCTGLVPQENDAADDCNSGSETVAKSPNGASYKTYAAQHASATIEDEGETRLANGFAHVSLDPAFASTISTTQPYLVFTTPMGESRGLYVCNRTPSGFDVRENAAGRSSMTFDYRIVAHPYGVRVARMAPIARKENVKHAMSAAAVARVRTLIRMHGGSKRATLKSHVIPRSFMSYAPAVR